MKIIYAVSVTVLAPVMISAFVFAPLMNDKNSRTMDLHMSLPNPLDTATSGLVSIFRFQKGVSILEGNTINDIPVAERPRIKILYDVENSLSCRKVREMITELDLVVENVIPAAGNSRVFTDTSNQYFLSKGMKIPRMTVVDNDKEETIVGTEDILEYLANKIKRSSATDNVDTIDTTDTKEIAINYLRELGGFLAFALRIGRGTNVAATGLGDAPRPKLPLILYSYEGNQFCRLVREVLTELDIVYELRSAGKGSPRRAERESMTGGSSQCPYLLDPNTDVAMAESADIIKYLYKNYGRWIPPNEILQWASGNVLPLAKPIYKIIAPIQAGASGEDKASYGNDIAKAKAEIQVEIMSAPVVIYTYQLSPFSFETKDLLDNLEVSYKEISMGAEWIPGLIAAGGSQKRAAFLELTGQSSLPQIFVGGESIGGIFSGTPGLVPALEEGIFMSKVKAASSAKTLTEVA